jgi:hypothetical protein
MEAKLFLGFTNSSTLGSSPKAPKDISEIKTIIKTTGLKSRIYSHLIYFREGRESLEGCDAFEGLEELEVFATVNRKNKKIIRKQLVIREF